MSFNSITIMGNVGRDSELRYTPTGVAVLDFSVATSKITGKGDTRKEKTTWFKCVIWRERAEALAPYILKGKKVLVQGLLEGRAYLDKNNQPQYSLEITCEQFAFADGPKGDSNGQAAQSAPADTNDNAEDTTDIPF